MMENQSEIAIKYRVSRHLGKEIIDLSCLDSLYYRAMEMKSWIRLARKKAGLTQEQLAEKLGLTKGNISAWENGRHEASFAQLAAIAQLSGLPIGHDASPALANAGSMMDWQKEDAARLSALFAQHRGRLSVDEFSRRFEIGPKIAQYLAGQTPLTMEAAVGFARGLGVELDSISPRLDAERRRPATESNEIVRLQPGAEDGNTPADRLQLVMAEQHLDVNSLAKLLSVESAVVRSWLEPDAPKLQLHHAVKLQDAYGYSPAWLINKSGNPKLNSAIEPELDEPSLPFDTIQIPDNAFRKIPVRGMAQLGDNGHFVDVEYPVGHGDGYVFFPTKDPDAYALRCNGESMRPRVKHNEFVVVEPNTQIQNGDEVLVKSQDGRVMVKELAYVRDGIVHLSSVNERHGMLRIPQDQIERMHFVGGIVKRSAWRPD
ncbi:helix-turn-helix domain-containing protein [Cupriavidus campinensis]